MKIPNYLFDIRNPGEAYSVVDFVNDIKRISDAEHIENKIITGGTIYYAYHYILRTQFEPTLAYHKDFPEWSKEFIVTYLEKNDPESLAFIDIHNMSRLLAAMRYIYSTGNKYSEKYFKTSNLLDNFCIILIYPKDREGYCKKLDEIVTRRLSTVRRKEIDTLLTIYGPGISTWLSSISYEYKYALQLYHNDTSKHSEIIQELQNKERQYTKRQMTFMRKLERTLLDAMK